MFGFKRTLVLLVFILVSKYSFSQEHLLIGLIKDTTQPVAYANVLLTDSIGETASGTITDEVGNFKLKAPKGNYTLTISFLGYSSFEQKLILEKDTDLGTIFLQPDDNQLGEVLITASKPLIERKVDRLVFNVGQSIAATGGDAMDALKVTPRIKVQNDEISMIGKGKLMVMLNDRVVPLSGEELATFLKSLHTKDIQSIEVISNPPAKYSAEGNNGMINIVTKKGASSAWNASFNSRYRQATYATGSIGGSFNLQKGKFQVLSDLNYTKGSSAPVETNQVYYPDLTWKEVSNRKDYSKALSTRLGIEYTINKKLSTGFNYRYINSQPSIKNDNTAKMYNSTTNVLDSINKSPGRNEYKSNLHNLNYHLIYKIDTVGRKLSLDFDFFNSNLETDREYSSQTFYADNSPTPHSYEKARNFGIQKAQNYSVNLDMEQPTAWAMLNYGAKISFIKTDNLFDAYDNINNEEVLNQNLSNRFNYKENTQALYLSAQKEFSDKWEAKVGLRMENTQTRGYSKTLDQTNDNDYIKFFPTAYLGYHLNDKNSFNLNYGRRISRPSYRFLNPFRWVSSPYSYSEGNPFLQPAFIDNFELEYSFKDKLFIGIYYSRTKDDFEQVTILEPSDNVQQVIPLNFLKNKEFGFNQTLIFKLAKWWNIYASADVYYTDTRSSIPITLQYLNGWNGEFTISNDYILNSKKSLLANISYNYTTKGVDNLDYNSNSNQLDASIKWLAFDKDLVISLYINDILSSNRFTYTTYSNGIKNSFRNYYDERYFRLSVIYNFGKSFKTTSRTSKNIEELNRAN